jgi:hypothetical protein
MPVSSYLIQKPQIRLPPPKKPVSIGLSYLIAVLPDGKIICHGSKPYCLLGFLTRSKNCQMGENHLVNTFRWFCRGLVKNLPDDQMKKSSGKSSGQHFPLVLQALGENFTR